MTCLRQQSCHRQHYLPLLSTPLQKGLSPNHWQIFLHFFIAQPPKNCNGAFCSHSQCQCPGRFRAAHTENSLSWLLPQQRRTEAAELPPGRLPHIKTSCRINPNQNPQSSWSCLVSHLHKVKCSLQGCQEVFKQGLCN